MRTVTIKDVAAKAGVSTKTVSRVINGEQHVRPEVRDAVMRVVAELDYRPNAFARSLSSSHSFLLGLFFDDPASAYAADVQLGALTRCRQRSYHLVVEPIDGNAPDWIEQTSASLSALSLSGVILTPPICDWPDLLALLERHGLPYVQISPSETDERRGVVRIDDRAAAREMTEHLIGLGHRDIGFIKGNPTHSASRARFEGFTAAMEDAGLAVRREWLREGNFTFRSGLDAATELVEAENMPTAIFASNDEMAFGALVAAMRHRIAVPEQLSVVGFDDAPISRMAWPQLTTIRQPNAAMAAAAVDLLTDPAYRAPASHADMIRRDLDYVLISRGSTGPVFGLA